MFGECNVSIEQVVEMIEEGRESMSNVVCALIRTLSK